jgi:hypothetical protein
MGHGLDMRVARPSRLRSPRTSSNWLALATPHHYMSSAARVVIPRMDSMPQHLRAGLCASPPDQLADIRPRKLVLLAQHAH